MRRKLAAGNWKMNGMAASLSDLRAIADHPAECEVLICPPATLIHRAVQAVEGTALRIGGQDCHAAESGAHTGDTSAAMLADAGASHVILGHSERRGDHGETNPDVRAKLRAALAAGLAPILCIGESLAEREAGETLDIVSRQIAGSLPDDTPSDTLVIAYEPIWAIGTGKIPTLEQIAEVHAHIRKALVGKTASPDTIPLLYGGSVKPGNAAEIFALPNVDGALVGGASLRAADFTGIISALGAA